MSAKGMTKYYFVMPFGCHLADEQFSLADSYKQYMGESVSTTTDNGPILFRVRYTLRSNMCGGVFPEPSATSIRYSSSIELCRPRPPSPPIAIRTHRTNIRYHQKRQKNSPLSRFHHHEQGRPRGCCHAHNDCARDDEPKLEICGQVREGLSGYFTGYGVRGAHGFRRCFRNSSFGLRTPVSGGVQRVKIPWKNRGAV